MKKLTPQEHARRAILYARVSIGMAILAGVLQLVAIGFHYGWW